MKSFLNLKDRITLLQEYLTVSERERERERKRERDRDRDRDRQRQREREREREREQSARNDYNTYIVHPCAFLIFSG